MFSQQKSARPKVVVIMPAYNAERTLKMTYNDRPRDKIDLIILVDDGSRDHRLLYCSTQTLTSSLRYAF
jgi:glycosyltransferase involved in cell wall biosynthesis